MRRLVVQPSRLLEQRLRLTAEESRYLVKVLRLPKGSLVDVRDGEGGRYCASLVNKMELLLGRRETCPARSGLAVHLAFAPPKGRRVDWLVEKATELGAAGLHPIVTVRTVHAVDSLPRMERIARAAARQSDAGWVPLISESRPLHDMLSSGVGDIKLVAHPAAEPGELRRAIRPGAGSAIVVTGPEGGLTEEELSDAEAAGYIPFRLGPQILRAETAPIVALSLLLHHLGDLG